MLKKIIKKLKKKKTNSNENILLDEIIKYNKEIISTNKKEKGIKTHAKKQKN